MEQLQQMVLLVVLGMVVEDLVAQSKLLPIPLPVLRLVLQ